MASIHKCNDGGQPFRVRWRDPDGRARSRRAPTKRAAEALRREVEAARAVGRRWTAPDASRPADLAVMIQAYLNHLSLVASESTTAHAFYDLRAFLRWLQDKYGSLHARLLTRTTVTEYHAHLVTTPGKRGPRSPATVRQIISHIRRLWTWLDDHEVFGRVVDRPRRIALRAAPVPRKHAPSWAEMDTAIAAAHEGWQYKVCWLQRCMGLRVSQALGVHWPDLDLERGEIHIRPVLGKSAQEKRGRIEPVAPVLLDELAGWGRREGPICGQAPKPENTTRPMRKLWERSGVRDVVWRKQPNHAFRHGFTAGLKRAGAQPLAVEYLLGHALPTYDDHREHLQLQEAVDLVPPVGDMPCVRIVSVDTAAPKKASNS